MVPVSNHHEESKILADMIARRNRKASTIVVSQVYLDEWIEQIPNLVAAEALTDWLKAISYKLIIDGDISMRECYGFQ